jgi:hypothetical protein
MPNWNGFQTHSRDQGTAQTMKQSKAAANIINLEVVQSDPNQKICLICSNLNPTRSNLTRSDIK